MISRRVFLFRHAERIDRVFPSWCRQANVNGSYLPYNFNQPRTLPKRRGGLPAYEIDPPITEIGKSIAQLTGEALRQLRNPICAIYSSPAFRCIETAQIIAAHIGDADLKIRIEPGLFDWYSLYDEKPIFMSTLELTDAGFKVAKNYRKIVSKQTLLKNFYKEKGVNDYYHRAQDVIQK